MKVFDLFCGTKSIATKAEELGHEVFTLDFKAEFEPDVCCDILEFDPESAPFTPDMIWASPPCTTFSVMSIGKHWNTDNTPKTEAATMGMRIVKKTIEIIKHYEDINPQLKWYIENPCGKLRKLDFMQEFMRKEVTYCQYGDTRRKPTDIWTNDIQWNPKPKCRPNGKNYKATCHAAAPRGSHSKGATQGIKGAKSRSIVPEALCEEVIRSAVK